MVLDDGEAARCRDADFWPVYKGASFNLWNPDTGIYYASADPMTITQHLQAKRRRQHRTSRSAFSEFDQDWINNPDTLPCLRPRIVYRDVTRPTDTRTVIAALVPARVVPQDTAPYLLRIEGTERDEAFLLGVLSSMILDWYARRTVELHLKVTVFGNLPIPNVDIDNDPVACRVVEVSGRLAAVDSRFTQWADAVGVPVGTTQDEPVKHDLIAELDACVALLYGLNEDDLAVIYDTFHKSTDHSERHTAVVAHFRYWAAT